jgi:uncharacterized NAD-dependent epimerase/dehydratase family protein
MIIPPKYLVFLGDVAAPLDAKTAFGLVDWRRDACAGQLRLPQCKVDLGIPDMTAAEAVAAGARTLVIGVAPFGGRIADAWIKPIVEAIDAGLNVASGMHTRLGSVPAIAEAAKRTGRSLFDVRHADRAFPVGTGRKRTGKRLLMVGTDCAVGKKYSALAIAKALQQAGIKATFRATGQTGILIAGGGVAIDAVVADFISGAAEWLSPDNDADHWDVIEGQGSLFHPAYAGVSTGLLHGSQPDAIVVCHDAGRATIDGYPDFAVPTLERCIDLNLAMGRLTNAAITCVGVSVNTSQLDAAARERSLREIEQRLGMPAFDPVATGPSPKLIERLKSMS